MRLPWRHPRPAGLVTAVCSASLLLALTGCGSQDGSTTGPTDESSPTSSSYFSPLDEFLNPQGAQPSSDTDQAAKDKQMQEIVADCMTDQGFEYLPFVYPTSTAGPGLIDDYGSRAWVQQYGYGYSTMNDMATSSSTGVPDPNQAIVEAMGPAEQQAYYAALYGDQGGGMVVSGDGMAMSSMAATSEAVSTDPSSTDATSTDTASTDTAGTDATSTSAELPASTEAEPSMVPLADQGCYGKAQAEVYGDMTSSGGNQDQFTELWNSLSTMYDSAQQDPRVAAAVTSWVDCMSGAGYPGFTAVWDANQQASEKWGELNGWNSEPMPVDGGVAVATSVSATPSTPPAAEVATFREYELKIALADYDCQQSSNYAKVSDTVRIELETAFLEAHRAELEQYRDVMNGGR